MCFRTLTPVLEQSRLNWARWRTAWRNPNVCEHDCGPRGACRCGVCVFDEQQTPCPLNPKGPQCAVCAGMRSVVVYIAQVFAVTVIIGIAVTLQYASHPHAPTHSHTGWRGKGTDDACVRVQ